MAKLTKHQKILSQIITHKKAMLQALEKSLGIVTIAAKEIGIDRRTHYRWLSTDKPYADAVESIADIALDFAESQLHKQIKEGEVSSTIFFLKTKGKKRGYVEKTEMEHSGNVSVNKTQYTLPDGTTIEM